MSSSLKVRRAKRPAPPLPTEAEGVRKTGRRPTATPEPGAAPPVTPEATAARPAAQRPVKAPLAPRGKRRQLAPPDAPQDDAPHERTYRLFYALRVPSDVAAQLAQAQRHLKGNWRAVRPDQLHVTLSYLPAVPPERVEDLKRLGVRLMQDLGPLDVRLRGTGYFPNEGSPRVWFVKVEADGLTELAQTIRQEVQALGLDTDDVPFKAHVTLARKKGPAPRVPPLTFDLRWTAGSGTLYRSILRKTGPIYEVESTFRFRGEARSPAPPPPPTPGHAPDDTPTPPAPPPQETP